jgi:signal transduction histidine kinase/ActR/RegA family two-component response regulator
MKDLFRGLPIKQKLVLMMMATSIAVLLLASVGYIATDYYKAREDLRRELTTQADLILKNSTAALEFLDPVTAQETLSTIAPNRHIRTACLYDGMDRLFSQYVGPLASIPCPTAPGPDGYHFVADGLVVVSSIALQGRRRTGGLLLRSDLDLLQTRLKAQLLIVAVLLVLTSGVALLMSSRLHSIVSSPITALARTATDVSSRGDYSLRAARTTDDELGVLVDAFNRMLERIQLRERELSAANEELRNEISERRRAEQERAELLVREREANRLKDEFLATLSHELRTPLNAILGWTKLLRSSVIPPSGVDRALEKVERNAHVQSRLVEDLLEVSRITTGKLRLEVKQVDLVLLVTTAVESIRPTAEARGVAIDRQFDSYALSTAGDSDRLQQVIFNLVSNAVKFTPPGGVVTVSLRRVGAADQLCVSDTGIGIEPGFLPHVFDTFRQADASSTRTHGGLGLGLSIVRHIVELHGGDVQAESEGINKGSRFTVRLPVRIPERPRDLFPAQPGGGPALLTGTLPGTHIVVVDDDRDTRELLQSVLESAGAVVRLAANADEGFTACLEDRPDVLISDIGMPGQDGYSLLGRIQTALGADVPRATVALTAFAGPEVRQRAEEAGFDRYMAKPFDAERLIEMLRQLLPPDDASTDRHSPRPSG